ISWINVSNFNSSVATPLCQPGNGIVTLTSTSLLAGSYAVNYSLSGANSSSTASTVTFSGGTGTLTIPSASLTNSGVTTITINSVGFVAGGCGQTPANNVMSLTVTAPATASAGPNQTVCSGGTITLAGTRGGSATSSTWTAPSGSFSDATLLNSTYTPSITSGTVILTLTTNDPDGAGVGCAPATSRMTVTVNPSPSVTLNASLLTICTGSSSTLTATSSGGVLSTISGSNNTPVVSNGTGTDPDPDPNVVSSNITLPAGTLTALSNITLTMTTVHTFGGDVTAVLTSPCGSSTIFSRPGGTGNSNDLTGTYTFTTTSGNVFPANTTPITSGTYNASFSGINIAPTCASIGGTWTLTLSTPATGGNSRALTLSSWSISIANAGNYTTVFNTVPVTSPFNPGSVSGTNNNIATAVVSPGATTTYTATTTGGNGCSSTSAPVIITVNPAPQALSADADALVICSNQTAGLNHTTLAATQVTWSTTGDGTFSPSATVNVPAVLSVTYTPGPNDIIAGTATVKFTTDDPDGPAAGCVASVSNNVILTINEAPDANAGPDQVVCTNETIQLAGSITGDNATPGTWTTSGAGTFSPNANTLNAVYIPGLSDIGAGPITLTLTTNNP